MKLPDFPHMPNIGAARWCLFVLLVLAAVASEAAVLDALSRGCP